MSDSTRKDTGERPPDWLDDGGRKHASDLLGRGITLPDVPFVRYVDEKERLDLLGEFFAESGIEQRPGPYSSAQEREAFSLASSLAWYGCCATYPLHPRYRPYTEKQIRILYDYYVDRLLPCLLSEGYDVGPAPSWEYFVANYHTGGQRWKPYRRVEIPVSIALEHGEAAWQEARRACNARARRTRRTRRCTRCSRRIRIHRASHRSRLCSGWPWSQTRLGASLTRHDEGELSDPAADQDGDAPP